VRHLVLGLALVAMTTTAYAENFDVFSSDFAGSGSQKLNDLTLGMDFVVQAEKVRIFQLGIWDAFGDGFQSSHEVAIYDTDTQVKLASLVFPDGQVGQLRDGYRYVNLWVPLELDQGDAFTIAVTYFDGNQDRNGNVHGTLQIDPAPILNDAGGAIINIGSSRYGSGTGFPGTEDQFFGGGPANRYLSGSFEYSPNPEPGTLVLLSSALAAGAAIRRRRKRKQQAA